MRKLHELEFKDIQASLKYFFIIELAGSALIIVCYVIMYAIQFTSLNELEDYKETFIYFYELQSFCSVLYPLLQAIGMV
jgi:hypothetical protein